MFLINVHVHNKQLFVHVSNNIIAGMSAWETVHVDFWEPYRSKSVSASGQFYQDSHFVNVCIFWKDGTGVQIDLNPNF